MLNKMIAYFIIIISIWTSKVIAYEDQIDSKKPLIGSPPAPGLKKNNTNDEEKSKHSSPCLTGHMTDVQNWVDRDGNLSPYVERQNAIDLTSSRDAVDLLVTELEGFRKTQSRLVRYLSLAKCSLRRVPSVFGIKDNSGRALYATIEYLTLFGNNFADSNAGDQYIQELNATNAQTINMNFRRPEQSSWGIGFDGIQFSRLRELDLRKCSIQILTDRVFSNMHSLEALYLGENDITHVSSSAFHGLRSLLHLDMSRNLENRQNRAITFEATDVFRNITNLVSLDLSTTELQQQGADILASLGDKLERLSICNTGILKLPVNVFKHTSIRLLDVTGNVGILWRKGTLGGLEGTLQVLYAKHVGLEEVDFLRNFSKLTILDLESNEIQAISERVLSTLNNLLVLNLDHNRMNTWFVKIFQHMKNLRILSLRHNNLNLISKEMIQDFRNISFIGLSGNSIVCNCHAREFFELAYQNQNKTRYNKVENLTMILQLQSTTRFSYHNAYDRFLTLITHRRPVTRACNHPKCQAENNALESDGNFRLFDFDAQSYQCLMAMEARVIPLYETKTCVQSKRESQIGDIIQGTEIRLVFLFIIPTALFPVLIFCYIFRRNLRYFCITVRNSATLSLISKDSAVHDDTIFNYDVFVSYCNDDRDWVLDHLLPHVEKDCNVSVCLHERDFQVGLSILENIVSCMDRSRSIMLILSQQFLLSQWCQFEMHLAQHRLLETRREDLILVLLEDIPRRLRPTTLHYLMLTKTYIVWPKVDSEQPVFWKRLARSLMVHKVTNQENVSLA